MGMVGAGLVGRLASGVAGSLSGCGGGVTLGSVTGWGICAEARLGTVVLTGTAARVEAVTGCSDTGRVIWRGVTGREALASGCAVVLSATIGRGVGAATGLDGAAR